jgi:hypothetical protein
MDQEIEGAYFPFLERDEELEETWDPPVEEPPSSFPADLLPSEDDEVLSADVLLVEMLQLELSRKAGWWWSEDDVPEEFKEFRIPSEEQQA